MKNFRKRERENQKVYQPLRGRDWRTYSHFLDHKRPTRNLGVNGKKRGHPVTTEKGNKNVETTAKERSGGGRIEEIRYR